MKVREEQKSAANINLSNPNSPYDVALNHSSVVGRVRT